MKLNNIEFNNVPLATDILDTENTRSFVKPCERSQRTTAHGTSAVKFSTVKF